MRFPFVGVYDNFLFFCFLFYFIFLFFTGPRSYPVPQRGERVKQRTVHIRNLKHVSLKAKSPIWVRLSYSLPSSTTPTCLLVSSCVSAGLALVYF
jgi:hypothetical protein